MRRTGIDIPRASMANWMIKLGLLVQPLINLMREQIIAGDIIQMDETTVQVLKEPGKTAQSKSYLWLQRGGPPENPIVLYHYDPGREASVAKALLDGFTGTLQTDGYRSYNAVVAANQLTHVGCWAHARRKFDEALRAQGKGKNRKRGLAHRGLSLVRKLYRIDKQAKRLSAEERQQKRQQQAVPVLKEIRTWLKQSLPKVNPTSATGKAMNYLHTQWPQLQRYVDDGRVAIDNNLAENAIRPFVVGRKNWLFSASVRGVKASANLYSLIETDKANGLEPYAYLRHLFTVLPAADTVEGVEALLPANLTQDQISVL